MNKIIEGIDLLDVIGCVDHKCKGFPRKMLDSIEAELRDDPEQYLKIRKIVLDGLNDYKRTILNTIFGTDFEGEIK
jgi:hypothetical protein